MQVNGQGRGDGGEPAQRGRQQRPLGVRCMSSSLSEGKEGARIKVVRLTKVMATLGLDLKEPLESLKQKSVVI